MASAANFVPTLFALSADAALVSTISFGVMGGIAALAGLYAVLAKADKSYGLKMLGLSSLLFFGCWQTYGSYQNAIAQANGIATGPIYEGIAIITVLCLPFVLVMSLIFGSPFSAHANGKNSNEDE